MSKPIPDDGLYALSLTKPLSITGKVVIDNSKNISQIIPKNQITIK